MTNLLKQTFIILIISFMSLKSAHTNDKVTLLLDWFINPDHGPIIIANEKGIFRDAGLEIEAACGGCCACATCHVYISEEWVNRLNKKEDEEESMLDQAFHVKNISRLSCQLEFEEKLDGIKLTLAPE